MYEQFNNARSQQHKNVTIDFTTNLLMTPDTLKQKFNNIDALSDKDLYDLFIKHFNDILDCIFKDKDKQMISLFTNARFITIATQAMYSLTISDTQRKRCNKLAYDYLVLKDDNKDENVSDLLISFSKVINKDVIPRLCGLGLSGNVSSMIALARYSSDKETNNVKRLNKVIMKQPSKIMTEQMIVDIYCILYTSALDLFEGVMYDIASYQNLNNNEIEIYGTISLALLDIINELPLNLIEEVLRRFVDNKQMLYPDNGLRFNIESISPEDYSRLLSVIDKLKAEHVYIPTT